MYPQTTIETPPLTLTALPACPRSGRFSAAFEGEFNTYGAVVCIYECLYLLTMFAGFTVD